MNRLTLLLAILLCANQAFADEPLVAPPPLGSTWSVSLEYPSAKKSVAKDNSQKTTSGSASEPRLPVHLKITTGRNGISEGNISYNDQTVETFYLAQGLFFVKASNTGAIFVLPAEDADLRSLKTAGFPGTGWIASPFRAGTAQQNGQLCAHYVYDIPEGNAELPAGKMEALVLESLHYPLQIRFDSDPMLVMTFTQPVPFNQEIALPRELQDVLDKRQAKKAALEHIRRINQLQTR